MDFKNKLKRDIKEYLLSVDKSNFYGKYNGLKQILISYNQNGLSKNGTILTFEQVDSEFEMDHYQDEVYVEIASCSEGFKSNRDNIKWI